MPQLVVITSKLRELIIGNVGKDVLLQECDKLDRQFDDALHLISRLALVGDTPEMLKPLKEEAERLLLRF